MKTSIYPRIVFGASAVLSGIIALMWRDADTWQSLRGLWSLPFGAAIGACLMILQVAGGIGIQFTRTVRAAALTLVIVYLLFAITCIPGIAAAPAVYARYGSFFEQFSLLCGAIALCAATETNAARARAHARAARIGFGLCAISFALSQAIYLRLTASMVPAWAPPNGTFWAETTTFAFAVAGAAILANRQAPLAIGMMTLMLVLFGVLVWIPLVVTHAESHLNWSEFDLTFLIAGAAWIVAETSAGAKKQVL